MGIGKITINDNLLRTVGLAATLLGVGYFTANKLNRIETLVSNLVWDVCHHQTLDAARTYRSCQEDIRDLQAQQP